MENKVKRIGYLPRKRVLEIIDEISKSESISRSKVVGILVEEALAARGIFDPSIGQSFQANPNWKAQAQSLMKKDTTEAPLPKVLNKEAEMMEQFREFQQFKKMMGK